jgi:hypothetical protein
LGARNLLCGGKGKKQVPRCARDDKRYKMSVVGYFDSGKLRTSNPPTQQTIAKAQSVNIPGISDNFSVFGELIARIKITMPAALPKTSKNIPKVS